MSTAQYGVMMCQVLNVVRSGFCAWLHNQIPACDKDKQRLLTLILDSYLLPGGLYSYRRIHGDQNEIRGTCGKNRVDRVMQAKLIKAAHGYKSPHRITSRPYPPLFSGISRP